MSEVAGVSLEINARDQVSERLAELLEAVQHPAPMFEQIGSSLETSTKMRFETQRGPDGERWAAHAPATLAILKKQGRIPLLLQRSRRLYGSLHSAVGPSGRSVAVGVVSEYGRIHQLGGMAGRGRKVQIPARPYLGISAEDRVAIEEIVTDHLEGK